MSVEVSPRGARGFHGYGPPFADTYGDMVEVYESSSAEGPHVWLSLEGMPIGHPPHDRPRVTLAVHLDEARARALIDRLQTWLDEIPSRWASSTQITPTEKET